MNQSSGEPAGEPMPRPSGERAAEPTEQRHGPTTATAVDVVAQAVRPAAPAES
jgi:hypothetical protein